MEDSELEELIRKINEAKEPSRELDGEISWALLPEEHQKVFNEEKHYPTIFFVAHGQTYSPLKEVIDSKIPLWTRSMDAAEKHLPNGFQWKAGYSRCVPHSVEIQDYRSIENPFMRPFYGAATCSRAAAFAIALLRLNQALQKRRKANG